MSYDNDHTLTFIFFDNWNKQYEVNPFVPNTQGEGLEVSGKLETLGGGFLLVLELVLEYCIPKTLL